MGFNACAFLYLTKCSEGAFFVLGLAFFFAPAFPFDLVVFLFFVVGLDFFLGFALVFALVVDAFGRPARLPVAAFLGAKQRCDVENGREHFPDSARRIRRF